MRFGRFGCGAGGAIFKHALAAGGVQCVELAVELAVDLAAFGGRDAGVADETQGICGSKQPFTPAFYRKEISSGLSGRGSGQSGAAGAVCGRVTTNT